MITVTIDNQAMQTPEGKTILQAAQSLGIPIPTLCFAEGFKPSTSCMVCVVHIEGYKHLAPACGTPVTEGMVVTTQSEEIQTARKTAIELLLSDHVGDCVGPCEKGCPAGMNIPRMLRQIAAEDYAAAIQTVKQDIALPAILGRICEAPCEKVCRRVQADGAVAICLLKRFVADLDLASENPYQPTCLPPTGKTVAVVGAGPCGLAAAYYLARAGIACTLYDRSDRPGGSLMTTDIDPQVVQAEIDQIFKLGVDFQGNKTLGRDVCLDELKSRYDAILLAIGKVDENSTIGLQIKENKIPVNHPNFETSKVGVFAAGTCIGSRNLCIRAVADGKEAAISIAAKLAGRSVPTPAYNHRMGRLNDEEMAIFLKQAAPDERITGDFMTKGLTKSLAQQQSRRCLHCDCRKAQDCQLRSLATQTGARQKAFEADRSLFEQLTACDELLFEPGKCIKCGLCIQAAKKKGEPLGLAFEGRGFDMRIAVPLQKPLDRALEMSAADCAAVCPTGALSINKSGAAHVSRHSP